MNFNVKYLFFIQGKLVSEIDNLRVELHEQDGICRNHVNIIAELEEELETLKEEAERKDPKASNVSPSCPSRMNLV